MQSKSRRVGQVAALIGSGAIVMVPPDVGCDQFLRNFGLDADNVCLFSDCGHPTQFGGVLHPCDSVDTGMSGLIDSSGEEALLLDCDPGANRPPASGP